MSDPETKTYLSIPQGPDVILRQVVEILDPFWDRHSYVLGGGTALAARWKHRHSTDIDLFIKNEVYESIYSKSAAAIRAELEEQVRLGEIFEFSCGSDAISIKFAPDESMSMVSSLAFTDEPLSNEYEERTGVRLESTAEILAKKVFVRMNWRGRYPARDVYDLVVAKYLEPNACDKALQSITDTERHRIAQTIQYDIQSRSLDPQKIEESKYPEIEQHMWKLSVDLFFGKELAQDFFRIGSTGIPTTTKDDHSPTDATAASRFFRLA